MMHRIHNHYARLLAIVLIAGLLADPALAMPRRAIGSNINPPMQQEALANPAEFVGLASGAGRHAINGVRASLPAFDFTADASSLFSMNHVRDDLATKGLTGLLIPRMKGDPQKNIEIGLALVGGGKKPVADLASVHMQLIDLISTAMPEPYDELPEPLKRLLWTAQSIRQETPSGADFLNLKRIPVITSFGESSFNISSLKPAFWYLLRLEPYLIRCGFGAVALALPCAAFNVEVRRAWISSGFSNFYLTKVEPSPDGDTGLEYLSIKELPSRPALREKDNHSILRTQTRQSA